jgi:hypothetical protein
VAFLSLSTGHLSCGFSKRQATVESSTFGSEMVALRQAVDMIKGLRYKLRMMGVSSEDATKRL